MASRLELSTRYALLVLGSAVFGLVGSATVLPSAVRGLAMLVFVLVGPGGATFIWMKVNPSALYALTPVSGVGWVFGLSAASALMKFWHPLLLLLALVFATALSSALWLRYRGPAGVIA